MRVTSVERRRLLKSRISAEASLLAPQAARLNVMHWVAGIVVCWGRMSDELFLLASCVFTPPAVPGNSDSNSLANLTSGNACRMHDYGMAQQIDRSCFMRRSWPREPSGSNRPERLQESGATSSASAARCARYCLADNPTERWRQELGVRPVARRKARWKALGCE